jgi:hypothetical protein
MKKVTIQGVELNLANPVKVKCEWIGQQEPLNQLLACWLTLSDSDQPLSPRIIGAPGLGKTTLAMTAGKKRKQDVYIFQCTTDTRPEDLLITPVLGQKGKILYHASPLLTAMITGAVCVLDEGNRMSEKSWASLASLLDDRRMVESIVAGITIPAEKEFRCVITMNDDSSTYEIPDYIMSRIQPAIELRFPDETDELKILQYNLPDAPDQLINICVGYLQEAHGLDLPYSIRDGLNAIRYAQRLETVIHGSWEENFNRAVVRRMQIGDFFFDEEDPLNPNHLE